MSMEQSWVVTCDSGWSMEEAAAAWSSDHRISFQTSLPSHSDSGMQLQVVEYAAPATPTHDICSDTVQVFEEATQVFNENYFLIMEKKMHKFPPSLVDVPPLYRVPVTVAIGPYYHGKPDLLEAEQVKHSAANQCIRDSTAASLQEMYNAVFAVLPDALNLYYQDELAKFRYDDFLPMMFIDACFLVQFMRWYYLDDGEMHQALESYFYANYERIGTDIMMLENQIPWLVVKTIFGFMPPAPSPGPWETFVDVMRRGLGDQVGPDDDIDVDPEYHPPHVLGLIWHYIVRNNNHHDDNEKDDDDDEEDEDNDNDKNDKDDDDKQISISVAELAAIGITLVPDRKQWKAGLMSMRLKKELRCFFKFGDLRLRPLYLPERNAAWLVNMAAFELCRTPDFQAHGVEARESAVCSYLHLFAMLLDQKQDVHVLQKEDVIQGGGLTSKMTLDFFTSIGKNMRPGTFYLDIITQIVKFKNDRPPLLKFFLFLKKKKAKVMALMSIIAAVVGILSSLQALKPP